jgi:hypothetical protein
VPFLINEDEAIKGHLRGIQVAGKDGAMVPVKVWFRWPEQEERAIEYPFITIELLDIVRETDREQRGLTTLDYIPEGYEDPGVDFGTKAELPIPVSLVYQLTTYARSNWHDRGIQAALLGNKLPLRFGALVVENDDTIRRLDFLDFENMDGYDSHNKRLFRKAYTVAVSSELLPEEIVAAQKVTHVTTDLYQTVSI